MRYTGESLWKLSYADLAKRCQEVGNDRSGEIDADLRQEAQRVYGEWSDAFAIDTHEPGGQQRQAGVTYALRKRTIEILIKTGEWAEA